MAKDKKEIHLTSILKVGELFIKGTMMRLLKQNVKLTEIQADKAFKAALSNGSIEQVKSTRSEPVQPIYEVKSNCKVNI